MAYERSDDGNSSTTSLQILIFEKIREHCQQMSTKCELQNYPFRVGTSLRVEEICYVPSTAPQPNETMKSDRVMKKER